MGRISQNPDIGHSKDPGKISPTSGPILFLIRTVTISALANITTSLSPWSLSAGASYLVKFPKKFQTSDFEPIIGQSPHNPPESRPNWQSVILKYPVAISEYFSISDLHFGRLLNACEMTNPLLNSCEMTNHLFLIIKNYTNNCK